jgi:hypothetical protein
MRKHLLIVVLLLAGIATLCSRRVPRAPAEDFHSEARVGGAYRGMSRTELIRVLGPPRNVRKDNVRGGPVRYTWQSADKILSATLLGDRLSSLTSFGYDLELRGRSFRVKSPLDDLNNELGPAAAEDWRPQNASVVYPSLHLQVRWNPPRQIVGFSLLQ